MVEIKNFDDFNLNIRNNYFCERKDINPLKLKKFLENYSIKKLCN